MHLFALPLSVLVSGTFAAYSDALQNILINTDKTDKYHYPTDFTRDIVPKPFHSHNDYWRDVPFYTALSYGAISIEADVWLINETLYVGHSPSSLTHTRTLSSLYLDPLLTTLRRQNPSTPFSSGTQNGVFDTSPSQTLYLFLDLKTPASSTWPAVLAALEPLRAEHYLTTYTGSELIPRAITVLGTGNTQYADVKTRLPRDIFFDAPLASLSSALYSNLSAHEAPIASTDFAAAFGHVTSHINATQLGLLREHIRLAREKSIQTRYWNLPAWPVRTRNRVWNALCDEGVDLLNVDDLRGASGFWEGGE